jgi:ribosomal-protein-alanine N-acetyltransferase
MSAVLSEDLHIRPVLPEHLAEIHAIEQAAYDFPWTEGLLGDCLKTNYSFYATFRQGGIVAYGVMTCVLHEAHILNLCVRPEEQGQGLGRMMLEFLLDKAASKQTYQVFLEVRKSNRIAQSLYESNGFNRLAERSGYYPNHSGREDAIIYAKQLSASHV